MLVWMCFWLSLRRGIVLQIDFSSQLQNSHTSLKYTPLHRRCRPRYIGRGEEVVLILDDMPAVQRQCGDGQAGDRRICLRSQGQANKAASKYNSIETE